MCASIQRIRTDVCSQRFIYSADVTKARWKQLSCKLLHCISLIDTVWWNRDMYCLRRELHGSDLQRNRIYAGEINTCSLAAPEHVTFLSRSSGRCKGVSTALDASVGLSPVSTTPLSYRASSEHRGAISVVSLLTDSGQPARHFSFEAACDYSRMIAAMPYIDCKQLMFPWWSDEEKLYTSQKSFVSSAKTHVHRECYITPTV